jgi:hypothetical protein
MADRGAGRTREDSTLRRLEKGLGFNARVEPIWLSFNHAAPQLGFFERRREKKRLKRIIAAVNSGAGPAGRASGWDTPSGECVCNLRVAKMGLIRELKTWVKNAPDGEAPPAWIHLEALRDRPCMMVPAAFDSPLKVDPGSGEEPFPVSSSLKLQEELSAINQRFRIDETFALKKMVDYLDATERDISIYESRYGMSEGFWAKFAYVLLKKLADVSAEKRLPVLLL